MAIINNILSFLKVLTVASYYICRFVTKDGRVAVIHEKELSKVDYYNTWFNSDEEDTFILHDKTKNKQRKLYNKDVIEFSFVELSKIEYFLTYSWLNILLIKTDFSLKRLLQVAIGLPVVITGYLLFVSSELKTKPAMEELLTGSIRMSYILFVLIAIVYLIVLIVHAVDVRIQKCPFEDYDFESRSISKTVFWHFLAVFTMIGLYGIINDDLIKSTYDAIRHYNGIG